MLFFDFFYQQVFFFDQQTDRCVDAFAFHLWSLLLRIQSLRNKKKRTNSRNTEKRGENCWMPPGVDVVGHGRPDIFFFPKKNYRGVQWKGSYLWTRKWADASDRMAGQKKKQNFLKNFFDLLGRLLTFWVISSPFCGFFSEKLNRRLLVRCETSFMQMISSLAKRRVS